MPNLIASALARIEKLPRALQNRALNFAFGRAVPFVRTTGVHYDKVSELEWCAHVPNKRRAQNHLKQVPAGAMIVLAESGAVTMMGMSLPPERLPLVKSLEAKFVRRSSGAIRAVARLTEEQLHRIKTEPKGEVVIEVEIRDETGEIPALITVVPAWTTRKKG